MGGMPEGDTVLHTARRLQSALAGRLLTRFDLRVPRFATADLTGRTVLDVTPRGKHLLTRIEGGLTLHSHLRMDGTWRVYAPNERWRGGPAHQIRAILGTAERTAVGYRLPVLGLLRTADEEQVVGHLGPDLLGPDWDPALALRNLLADPARTVGDALLDQRNLAGIGNVFKCETCFVVRTTPWLPIGDLPAPERLVSAAKRLLEANRDRLRRHLFVYGRGDLPCRRCGTPISKAEQDERPVYWCPRCQSGPTPLGPVPPGPRP